MGRSTNPWQSEKERRLSATSEFGPSVGSRIGKALSKIGFSTVSLAGTVNEDYKEEKTYSHRDVSLACRVRRLRLFE
jgi:hypothetical protein